MMGRKIPFWTQVLETVKQAHEHVPEVRFIGWDVAIDQSGPLLIEGNHDPDIDLLEFVGQGGYLNVIKEHLTNN